VTTASLLVLAYTGRPNACAAIGHLAAQTGAEVVTVTLDLGQGADLEQISADARAAGAARAHVVDARDLFAADVLLPSLRAGAIGGSTAVRASALAWPVVARVLVDVARMEGASLVAHGAVGPDRAALDLLLADAAPDLGVVALDAIAAAPSTGPRVVANLWGRSLVVPPGVEPESLSPAVLYTRTSQPRAWQVQPAIVELTFEQGLPVAVNGIPMPFAEIVEVVDTIAGDHGVGRADRTFGSGAEQVREISEAPAAVTLAVALADLEASRLDPRLLRLKRQLAPTYAGLVEDGGWFSPARRALDAFVAAASSEVCGVVRVMLFQGTCRVVGPDAAAETTPLIAALGAGVLESTAGTP
jgi:argininosuccinate synthase